MTNAAARITITVHLLSEDPEHTKVLDDTMSVASESSDRGSSFIGASFESFGDIGLSKRCIGYAFDQKHDCYASTIPQSTKSVQPTEVSLISHHSVNTPNSPITSMVTTIIMLRA
jgi:hypothetical protein